MTCSVFITWFFHDHHQHHHCHTCILTPWLQAVAVRWAGIPILRGVWWQKHASQSGDHTWNRRHGSQRDLINIKRIGPTPDSHVYTFRSGSCLIYLMSKTLSTNQMIYQFMSFYLGWQHIPDGISTTSLHDQLRTETQIQRQLGCRASSWASHHLQKSPRSWVARTGIEHRSARTYARTCTIYIYIYIYVSHNSAYMIYMTCLLVNMFYECGAWEYVQWEVWSSLSPLASLSLTWRLTCNLWRRKHNHSPEWWPSWKTDQKSHVESILVALIGTWTIWYTTTTSYSPLIICFQIYVPLNI